MTAKGSPTPGDEDDPRLTTEGEDGQGRGSRSHAPRNAAEWATLAISAAIIALLVGVAVFEHLTNDSPAGTRVEVVLALDEVYEVEGRFFIPFTATNRGATPAEDVVVTFTVRAPGPEEAVLEEGTADLAYLANSGERTGQFATDYDPATYPVEASVSSFQTP
ncbi:MAG: hypothetical protein M3P94_05255 [Chloroflexota bacterium]|nr:hypothetical protein [Chloroflexota bacterium]